MARRIGIFRRDPKPDGSSQLKADLAESPDDLYSPSLAFLGVHRIVSEDTEGAIGSATSSIVTNFAAKCPFVVSASHAVSARQVDAGSTERQVPLRTGMVST